MFERDPHALSLLTRAVENSSKAAVAAEIGYSRTAVSLYMGGTYDANPEKLEAAIRASYDRYTCPHTRQEISGPECQHRLNSPKPFGGRAKRAHWDACQKCQGNGGNHG